MPILLQICVEGNTGSTGRIAEQIGIMAIENGWTSYIAYSRFRRPSKSKVIHIGTKLDIIFHGIITRLLDKHGFGSKGATRKLIKKIKEIKPDIIHLHNLHGYYINIEILFQYLTIANIQLVWTLHDCWPMTGHCAHFDFIGCEKWKTECHHCPQKKEYPKSILADRSRQNYRQKKELFTAISNTTIVCVSEWLNSIVKSSFLSEIPRVVFSNGIDVQTFSPRPNQKEIKAKYDLEGKFIILGVAGVWSERKGMHHFIELSQMISQDKALVLVGLTKRQMKKMPKSIKAMERTESMVHLAELYSIADVYLSLSTEESFGLTIAEALACGTPSIVYNSTASPELVSNETGIVVEKGNFKGILAALETVQNNGKSFYSAACRVRAVKYFNKVDRHKEYIDLYERLILS